MAARLVRGDDVGIAQYVDIDVLAALDLGQGADAVAQEGGALELELFRQVLHAQGELFLHLLAAAGEERARLVDELGIALLVDAADAGAAAALDLVEEAWARAGREHAVAARAQEERALQRDERAVHRAGRGEGAEIIAGIAARAAMLGQLREIVVAGEVDVGKRLVVAKQHVVARHQALDEVAFEQQRLDFGMGDDDLERVGLRDHAPQAVRQRGGVGVVGDARLEIARLADIERIALGVEHAIDAGAGRQRAQRRADHACAARQLAAGRGVAFVYGGLERAVLLIFHPRPHLA